ncbi:hypothetical protein ACFL1H_01945 [Nanoarchaeota archaeon]
MEDEKDTIIGIKEQQENLNEEKRKLTEKQKEIKAGNRAAFWSKVRDRKRPIAVISALALTGLGTFGYFTITGEMGKRDARIANENLTEVQATLDNVNNKIIAYRNKDASQIKADLVGIVSNFNAFTTNLNNYEMKADKGTILPEENADLMVMKYQHAQLAGFNQSSYAKQKNIHIFKKESKHDYSTISEIELPKVITGINDPTWKFTDFQKTFEVTFNGVKYTNEAKYKAAFEKDYKAKHPVRPTVVPTVVPTIVPTIVPTNDAGIQPSGQSGINMSKFPWWKKDYCTRAPFDICRSGEVTPYYGNEISDTCMDSHVPLLQDMNCK